ncbi:MAG: glycosyltransferase [Flavobacteriaceae bacterium]|nr:MAG: glycosyltransferase [Flavobacteriaceae bacterium]
MPKVFQLSNNTMKDKRLKILFILPSLKAGGAERIISFVSTSIDKTKFHSILLVLGNIEDAVYPIDGIEVHYLSKKRLLHSIREIFGFIRSQKPQVVVGSIAHVNRVLSVFRFIFRKVIFIGREASVDLIIAKYTNKNRVKYWKLYKNYYRNLHYVICQSDDMADDLVNRYNLSEEKIVLINNPISVDIPMKSNTEQSNDVKRFITIGRFNLEKGHDRILRTISKLNIPFHYTLIGDGPEKQNIFDLAEELQMRDKISHIPYTDDVGKYLAQNDLFLQGSFVEGFPNTALESCVVGTPVVAFKCMGGTREIIENDINGYIANDTEAYLQCIKKALNKDWDPSKVRHSVMRKFSKEIILPQYEDFFQGLREKHNI